MGLTETADRQLGQNCDRGDRQRVVLTEDGGCRGGGDNENVGELLMDMAEDKGDVKPSDDMSGAGDSGATGSTCRHFYRVT